ncbi:AAEL002496-PA [Aedes aegypti]|uniref:AAEL002496-PA n=1 Tax=Aedes aegypti TaxID=7159 RepID=Q17I36_AEDAE|nr:AAEL002496-PA [Aedes aegypti]
MTAAVRLLQGQSVASICRLCFMERDQLELIFDADRGYCSQWIEKLTSLKIDNVPNAPSSLCAECKSTLESFDAFREMCITNDLVFKETFCSEDLSVGDIKVESIEDQHENIVILQTDSESNSCDIPAGQDSIDAATSTKLVIDDFEIKVHDMDTSVEANIPIMTMIPVMNGDEIGNFSHENHDSAMTDADHKFNIIGPTIDISSSVESDSSMDAESNDNPTQNLTDENNHMSLTVDDILSDCFKYPFNAQEIDNIQAMLEETNKPSTYVLTCDVCMRFSSKLHVTTHKDAGIFECHICSKRFDKFMNCTRHIKLHVKRSLTGNISPIEEKEQADEHTASGSSSSTNYKKSSETHLELDVSSFTQDGTDLKREAPGLHIDSSVEDDDEDEEEDKPQDDEALSANELGPTKTESKMHNMTHKAKGLFQCYICAKKFNRSVKCVNHINWHLRPNKVTLSCNFCKICMKFKSKIHVTTHKAVGLYVCHLCKNAYKKFWSLTEHMKNFLKQRYLVTCKICDKNVSKLHMKTHKADKRFMCYICSKMFKRYDYVSKHISKKTIPRMFECKICHTSVTKLHAESHKAEGFQCPICLSHYVKFDHYSRHIKVHRDQGKYTCKICNRVLVNAVGMARHEKLHKRELPRLFECYICAKKFDRFDKCRNHLKWHVESSESSSHYCKICMKIESKLHVMSHKAVGSFICQICMKRFSQIGNLNLHMRWHSMNNKRYQCPVCTSLFNRFDCFSRHVRNHKNKGKFVCDVCNAGFSCTYRLNRHKRQHAK